jgi:hypothetical protein
MVKPFPVGDPLIRASELSVGVDTLGVDCGGAKVKVVDPGVGTSAGTGVIPRSEATLADGQAIFVHARPALKHLHALQALDPVSFPDHPLFTTSPSLRVQAMFFSISPSVGVRVGSVDTGKAVGVNVGGGVAVQATSTTNPNSKVIVFIEPMVGIKYVHILRSSSQFTVRDET